MNAQSHKWLFTRKPAVFGLTSTLPPLVGGTGGLVCELVGKADLLSDHFWNLLVCLLTCHPSTRLTTFAFRSSEVRHLLLDVDLYEGSDSLGRFPLFLKRIADVLAPCLSLVFYYYFGVRCARPGESEDTISPKTPTPHN